MFSKTGFRRAEGVFRHANWLAGFKLMHQERKSRLTNFCQTDHGKQ